MIHSQTQRSRGLAGPQGRTHNTFGNSTSGGADLLLSRLDGVKRAGKGWIATCPAHVDRSPSLAITEADGGTVLLHCHSGCSALAVVQSVGLSLADLFPTRLAPMTPEGRRAARRAALHADWDAALGVLARESAIVALASRMVSSGEALAADDADRLTLAVQRIESAREVLHGRR